MQQRGQRWVWERGGGRRQGSSRGVEQVVAAGDVVRVGQARGAHRPVAQLLLAHRRDGREALRRRDAPSKRCHSSKRSSDRRRKLSHAGMTG